MLDIVFAPEVILFITGLVQIVKMVSKIPEDTRKWLLPVLATVVGGVLNPLWLGVLTVQSVIVGCLAGMSVSGVINLVKGSKK